MLSVGGGEAAGRVDSEQYLSFHKAHGGSCPSSGNVPGMRPQTQVLGTGPAREEQL